MCTALNFKTRDHYFGRNLDIDRSYNEEVCVMPRRFPIEFRKMGSLTEHYAMIGMATVIDGIPLFYEASNEHGLSMAGLNFPENAYYMSPLEGKDNAASFELIPHILGRCKTVEEARELLLCLNIVDIAFAEQLPPSPLHWIISDRDSSVVLESMRDGLHIYDDPVGALTNNPPFPYHMANLEKYRHLRHDNAGIEHRRGEDCSFYCQGLGAVGLPGDLSSMSRLVRIVFNAENSVCSEEEAASVGQLFHLLSSVEMVRGACMTDEGTWDITRYSACINTDRGLYYYTTYENRRITCIDMHNTDIDGESLARFPLLTEQSIEYQN